MPGWEILVGVVIGKVSPGPGADGLAIWYTKTPGSAGTFFPLHSLIFPGPAFGNTDKWDGLGIFLDTFNNLGGKV